MNDVITELKVNEPNITAKGTITSYRWLWITDFNVWIGNVPIYFENTGPALKNMSLKTWLWSLDVWIGNVPIGKTLVAFNIFAVLLTVYLMK